MDWVTYGALTPEHQRALEGLYSDDDFEVLSMTEREVGFAKDLVFIVTVQPKKTSIEPRDIIVRVSNLTVHRGWGGTPTVAVKGKGKKRILEFFYHNKIAKDKIIKGGTVAHVTMLDNKGVQYKALTPEHIAQVRYNALTPEHEKQMIEDAMPMILSAIKGMGSVQLKHVSDALIERRDELNKEIKRSLKIGDIVTFLDRGEKWTGKISKIGKKLIYVDCTTPRNVRWKVAPNVIIKIK